MIVTGGSNIGVAFDNNYRFFGRTAWQWQPTLTVHDPSPPITLEDAAVAGGVFIPLIGRGPGMSLASAGGGLVA